MDTVKYLNQALELERQLEHKQENLMRLEQRMIYVSPTSREATGATSSSPNPNKLTMQMAQKEQLEDGIDVLKAKIVDTRKRIMRTIESVYDHDSCDVLYLKYIRGYNFKKIGAILERDTKWVYYKHGVALEEVGEKLKEYRVYRRNTVHVYSIDKDKLVLTGTIIEAAEYIGTTLKHANAMLAQGVRGKRHLILPDPFDYNAVIKIMSKYDN